MPDKILILDNDTDVIMGRLHDFDGDKWENEDREFFEFVRNGYRQVAEMDILKDRSVIVDARGSKDEVFKSIITELRSDFPNLSS
jgi:thymidylate kinase